MSQFSGFIPIRFHQAGKLLAIFGVVGLIAVGVSAVTGWFTLPAVITIVSIVFILVGLYLIYVVPREHE